MGLYLGGGGSAQITKQEHRRHEEAIRAENLRHEEIMKQLVDNQERLAAVIENCLEGHLLHLADVIMDAKPQLSDMNYEDLKCFISEKIKDLIEKIQN